MKTVRQIVISIALLISPILLYGQELQFLYDFRHSTHPRLNEKNFPSVDFKYFKQIDTINTGAFMMEVQSFLNGSKSNMGQTFVQLSQSLKFWKPAIFAYFYYSGGLGVTPNAYGYYISNAYSFGSSYLIGYQNLWINLSLLYRYSAMEKPSHDPQVNFYIGGTLFKNKIRYSSTLVLWSNNKDDGSGIGSGETGKKVLFFADPQIWFKVKGKFSLGSKGSVSYHIAEDKNRVILFPAIGIKRDF